MNENKLGFLFLGAGSSSRMLGDDKLLKKINGVTQIQKILNEALALNFSVFVTIPANNIQRKDAISKTNALIIEVENSHLGMGHSLSVGVNKISQEFNLESIAVCPSDLPELTTAALKEVTDFFLECPEMICCPIDENNSTTGHPVIFPRKYFNSLTEITGDIGAREVLKKDKHSINYFSTKRRSYFLDLDTPEEWSSWINSNKN
jgi:CTP:molybdopterin cytidylyltransferase MocA